MGLMMTNHPGQNAGRGQSYELWNKFRYDESSLDLNVGFVFCDDFLDLPTGKYTATQATAGTFALGDGDGGVALADCNSTTVTQGINVQLGGTAGEIVKCEANTMVFFEARVKGVDIATGPEFFLGLSETDTTIIGTSANTSTNHIGFESVSDDGILLFHSEKAGTRGSATTPHTLVEDTWVKLGFVVDGLTSVTIYVDGEVSTATNSIVGATHLPIVEMRPSLVCQSDGATDSIVHIDWWACGKMFRSG